MTTAQAKPTGRLKPFRHYLADAYQRGVQFQNPEERVIMEAKAIVVPTDVSASERRSLIEGFYIAIRMMNDSGGKIVATAVVVE